MQVAHSSSSNCTRTAGAQRDSGAEARGGGVGDDLGEKAAGRKQQGSEDFAQLLMRVLGDANPCALRTAPKKRKLQRTIKLTLDAAQLQLQRHCNRLPLKR